MSKISELSISILYFSNKFHLKKFIATSVDDQIF